MGKRYFHWDVVNDCVMHETNDLGDTLVSYTHEPRRFGPLISETRDGTTFTHHYDALGSTTILTDDSGAVTDTFADDAWGNQVARTGTTSSSYRWQGRFGYQFDLPTATFYVRARTYRPQIARWAVHDPILFWDTLNLYGYAHNSPVILVDSSGLACGGCCITSQISLKSSGPLQGGFSLDDYLVGAKWSDGNLPNKSTLGSFSIANSVFAIGPFAKILGKSKNVFGLKVQLYATFAGPETCTVDQGLKHSDSNDLFLDETSEYAFGKKGQVKNGQLVTEPLLDATKAERWIPKFKGGTMSFADAPSTALATKGTVEFTTVFASVGSDCVYKFCVISWLWTVSDDKKTNTVAVSKDDPPYCERKDGTKDINN